jgi:hypothetical protein
MVTDIVTGISRKINNIFGDDYLILGDEDLEQNLVTPAFFIMSLNIQRNQIVGQRYRGNHSFDIHYFPVDKNNNIEMQSVGDKLTCGLEYITLLNDDLLRGTEMSYSINDGVLHFFVSFNMTLIRYVEHDVMEELEHNIEVR